MRRLKRLFDLFWSSIGILLLLPFLAVIMLLIKLDDRGPVFFRQKRIGFQGRPFYIWKFRTMIKDAEKLGKLLTVDDDPRITGIGRWLRKLKLDELPQLINVLKGEMSLVGPRPEVGRYVAFYTPEQRLVLNVVPGITDPASIKYRDESELLALLDNPEETYVNEVMPEKIRLNLEYAVKANVLTDFVIILSTFLTTFRKLFPRKVTEKEITNKRHAKRHVS